jgi:hypothetical protein
VENLLKGAILQNDLRKSVLDDTRSPERFLEQGDPVTRGARRAMWIKKTDDKIQLFQKAF